MIPGGNPFKRSKWFLNDKNTITKLKKAARKKPMKIIHNQMSDKIEFSTGAYVSVVLPLLKFWEETEGDVILKTDVGGMNIRIVRIETTVDDKDKITGYIVRLLVEGQNVTVTLYDTTLSLMVQADSIREKYFDQVLFSICFTLTSLSNEIQILNNIIYRICQKVSHFYFLAMDDHYIFWGAGAFN